MTFIRKIPKGQLEQINAYKTKALNNAEEKKMMLSLKLKRLINYVGKIRTTWLRKIN
jgi:hypothetical protein